jgi:hypothetical protein
LAAETLGWRARHVRETKRTNRRTAATLFRVVPAAAVTITIHVLEIVAFVIAVLLYLLIKVWRRI